MDFNTYNNKEIEQTYIGHEMLYTLDILDIFIIYISLIFNIKQNMLFGHSTDYITYKYTNCI